MKLEEFLKENEGKTGMAEKLTPEGLAAQGVELSDDELDLATGGRVGNVPSSDFNNKNNNNNSVEVYRRDSKGNATHWINTGTGKIYYYPCPRCGRVTHKGLFGYVYCDPCDTYWCTWDERRVYIN